MSDYKNKLTDVVCGKGDSIRVTLSSTGARGALASLSMSLARPCRYARLQCATGNAGTTRVRIGSACSTATGVALGGYPVLTPYAVDDLNNLYFTGTDADIVDIEYFM